MRTVVNCRRPGLVPPPTPKGPPCTAPRRRAAAALTLASALALAGCGADSGGDGQAGSGEPAAVATTTQLGSVLGDVARCAGATTATVMGPGDDPHDFAPSSQQVAQMARAGLVFANGFGLEAGMASALENAAQDGAQVLEVAPASTRCPSAPARARPTGTRARPRTSTRPTPKRAPPARTTGTTTAPRTRTSGWTWPAWPAPPR